MTQIEPDAEIYWIRINGEGRIAAALIERAYGQNELEASLNSLRSVEGNVIRVIANRGTVIIGDRAIV